MTDSNKESAMGGERTTPTMNYEKSVTTTIGVQNTTMKRVDKGRKYVSKK